LRWLLALMGLLIGTPAFLFFWIGSQTFVKSHERFLAMAISVETAALLAFSVTLLFTAGVQRAQALLLALVVASLAIMLAIARLAK
jgi:hypothetical protein